jgi:transglutaminase-like putative cysteine protease
MQRRLAVFLIGVLVAGGALAFAQDAPPRHRVLHEDLTAPTTDDDSPMIGEAPREGKNPAAFASGDKVLPEPAPKTNPGDQPVLGRGGFAADRDTETRPDLHTGPDGTLKYVSVFNPDVLPFKRMTAMDAVRDDYTLYVRSTVLTDVAVGNGARTTPSRDRFWGDVLVELSPGRDVPLPSVAPDMRILSYEATPKVALTFSKDGADNFYVRSDDAGANGTYRLVFLADADAGYFAPQLPARRYSLDDVRRRAEREGLLPELPDTVLAEAKRSLRTLRIDPDDDLDRAFNALVRWHREFAAKQLGDFTGNIYRDLFDEQAGVCRHRSFTFIVTATAAGIPTRYVTNEAHAFVEVWFPERGWQRVDLGGAALRMEVSNAEGKTIHRPRAEDPFDKPKAYEENYTQLEGDIRGLTEEQLAERRVPLDDGGASGDYDKLVDGDGPGTGDGTGTGDAVDPGDVGRAQPPDPAKRTPSVAVTMADSVGYRGEAVHVEGRVDDADGGPLPGTRVDVFVAPVGSDGNGGRLIGRGATDRDGRFSVDADLPGDLDLRTYEIYVTTPDTDTHNSGRSD